MKKGVTTFVTPFAYLTVLRTPRLKSRGFFFVWYTLCAVFRVASCPSFYGPFRVTCLRPFSGLLIKSLSRPLRGAHCALFSGLLLAPLFTAPFRPTCKTAFPTASGSALCAFVARLIGRFAGHIAGYILSVYSVPFIYVSLRRAFDPLPALRQHPAAVPFSGRFLAAPCAVFRFVPPPFSRHDSDRFAGYFLKTESGPFCGAAFLKPSNG